MNLFTHLTPADGIALLTSVAVKGALILVLAFLVTGLLRRASAATRHAVWAFALGAALVLPLLFVTLPGWQVAVLPPSAPAPAAAPEAPAPPAAPEAPEAPAPPAVEHRAQQRIEVLGNDGSRAFIVERHRAAPSPVVVTPMPEVAAAESAGGFDWQSWVLFAWLAGVAAVALRWVFAVIGAWRLVQHAEPVYDLDWLDLKERIAFGMDLDRPVRLLRSDRVSVPIAGGIFDPVVVLPSEADAWDEERREVVLTHELAHIVRWDCLTQTIAQGAAAIHWFNPLVWMGYRRFMLEREHACDDFVLNHGARASDYAQHLIQIARRFRREKLSLAATAPMARRSNLEGRVLSILDPEQNRQSATLPRLATVGVLTLALVAPLAAFQPVESERVMQTASIYELPPLPSISVVAPRLQASDETFTWEGRVGAGGFVEIHGVNGEIRARTGSGDRVRVEAEKSSRRGQEDEVEIVVEEFRNGVVLCAVYPGQEADCEPGRGARGDIRNNDVQVTFDVVVPENVRFLGYTVNGSIKTETLGADVEARTVNGSIRTASRSGDVTAKTVNGSIVIEAGGLARGHTVNGSITARMGQARWEQGMGFETTNGSITLHLPDAFSADVRAKAQSGSIKSDFPLRIERNSYVGSQASGAIGSGGAELQLDVLNGSIKLLRGSGSVGMRLDGLRWERDHQREVEREMKRNRAEIERSMREVERAMAEIGPAMELAMAEAGRAMAEVDFEHEIARAMDDVNWNEIEAEIERAMAEASVEMDIAFEEARLDKAEARAEAKGDLEEALADIRRELDEVRREQGELRQQEDRVSGEARSELRAARAELRAVEAALREAERGLERALCRVQEQHDEDCPDNQ